VSALTAPVPDVRRRDAAASRRAILDAAEQLFAQRGYDRASLGEIGRRAGVSAALPAYFFGCKEALYAAVLDRLLPAVVQTTTAVMEGFDEQELTAFLDTLARVRVAIADVPADLGPPAPRWRPPTLNRSP